MTTKTQRIAGTSRSIVFGTSLSPSMFERIIHPITHGGGMIFDPEESLGRIMRIPADPTIKQVVWQPLMPEWKYCPFCGECHATWTMKYVEADDLYVCPSCYEDNISCCDDCGTTVVRLRPVIGRHGVHKFVCARCQRGNYSECDMCGVWHHDSHLSSTDDKSMCPSCDVKFRSTNHYCRKCSTWHKMERTMELPSNGERVCVSCYVKATRVPKPQKACKGYGHTPGVVFFTTEAEKILFLGAEVEVTNEHYQQDYDRIDPTFAEDLMAFQEVERKSDGSIPLGHELATFPMELGYHQKWFRWNELMALHIRHHFDGHDSPKAAIHIHGSRAFFGERKTAAQDLKIGKLLFLLDRQDWRNNWKKFSRRNNKAVRDAGVSDPWGYCKWYDIDWDNKTLVEGLGRAMDRNIRDRNFVLNFYDQMNSPVKLAKTVEWRGLKSHTNYRVILAAIEMMHLLCTIAESKITEVNIRAMTWKQLCKKIPNTSPDLVWYLQQKRLWGR